MCKINQPFYNAILLVLIQGMQLLLAENVVQCDKPRGFQLLFPETVLTKNVIASYKVESHSECLFHCYENKECVSYNYEYALMDSVEGELRLCEINNMRMSSCPTREVSKEDHGYFEATDHEQQLYGSEKNPGLSCLDIQRCHDNDGEYWLLSELTFWKLTKVFCYLNTAADAAINLAYNKATKQSSTHEYGFANNAVDGDRESEYNKHSCTHTTDPYSNSPWWRVDVGNVYFIRKLIITNRSDCCWQRLTNFQIRIGLSLDNNGNSNPLCGGNHFLKEAETKSIVCPNPMLGRYVNIIIPGPDKALTLCEVEVYP